jgi:nucleoside phosphorylase
MKLLVVAADKMEFRGITQIGTHTFHLVAEGVGVGRSGPAAEAGIEAFRPDALVSTGFCGALVPDLQIADILVATEVVTGDTRYPAAPIQSGRPYRLGVVRTSFRVAQTVEERRKLRATGADAVEMEASAVAECAHRHSLPFYCVKVVTDLAGETMANDFNRALREDGHFDTIVLLKGSLRNPFARVPELLRLRRRCARAAQALGDFFADCRF